MIWWTASWEPVGEAQLLAVTSCKQQCGREKNARGCAPGLAMESGGFVRRAMQVETQQKKVGQFNALFAAGACSS